jgi:hypothetical protein
MSAPQHTSPLPFITPYCWGYWWLREDGWHCAWLGGHVENARIGGSLRYKDVPLAPSHKPVSAADIAYCREEAKRLTAKVRGRDVTAYILGGTYLLVGYTLRVVVYCVVYAAVYVFIVALVLDDRSERLFKGEKQWLLSEERNDSDMEVSHQSTIQVNQ